jgi:hypothetical protein
MTMLRHATAEEIFATLDGIEPSEARALLELLESMAAAGDIPREDVPRWTAMLQVFAVDPATVQ